MNLIWMMTFLFQSTSVWAGDKIKNGGDVVVCSQGTGKTYEVLDLVEAQMLAPPSAPVIVVDDGSDLRSHVEFILNRIEKFNPTRAQLYRNWYGHFFSEAQFVPEATFTDLPDEGGNKIFPAHCQAYQAVIQFRKLDFRNVRYLINQDLWRQMTDFQRSALIFHELLYRELTSDNRFVQDSSGVRIFNAYLHSTSFDEGSLKNYVEMLRIVGFKKTDANGYEILLNSGDEFMDRSKIYPVGFHNPNRIQSATLGQALILGNTFQTKIESLDKSEDIKIFFSPSGSAARLVSSGLIQISLDEMAGGLSVAVADTIELNSPERLISSQLVNTQKNTLDYSVLYDHIHGETRAYLLKRGESQVEYWSSGQVKMIKRWSNPEEMKLSFIKVENRSLSLFDLHLDRVCFTEAGEPANRCEDISNDWF